jgi:hypothetical protein
VIVLGCYHIQHAAERQQAIIKACAGARLSPPDFSYPSFIGATAEAIIQARGGAKVVIVADISDLEMPARHQGYAEVEWREGWLAHLEAHGIAFHPVGDLTVLRAHLVQTTRASVIRAYKQALSDLEAMMRRELSTRRRVEEDGDRGYVCGRPPYGYCVEAGRFKVHDQQREAVKLIFKEVRRGSTMASILSQLHEKFSEGGLKKRKVQFWDRVKIRRILKHARIYCLGEYASTSGHTVVLPELSFLPKEWVGTGTRDKPEGAVPSVSGGGTLVTAPNRRTS